MYNMRDKKIVHTVANARTRHFLMEVYTKFPTLIINLQRCVISASNYAKKKKKTK